MEGLSDAALHIEIKDEVTTRISERVAGQSPNPLWLRICKVQYNLRNVNEMAYEPVVLSIGPYHHGKSRLRKMEDLKSSYLQSMLERRNETDANRYVVAMREMEERARDCYADWISLDKDDFIMMMVLDGCFIVELFLKFLANINHSERDTDDLILGKDWLLRSIQRDLLLCENQLPFFVLERLFEMVTASDDRKNIHVHALAFFWSILEDPGRRLVDLLFDVSYYDSDHLLSMMYNDWHPSLTEAHFDPFSNMPPNSWIFKFSATELQEAGIEFKRTPVFTPPFKIKFSNGVLEIPPLTIHQHTESFFRNLLAYEQQQQEFKSNTYITDYIRFMDILIDSEKDVKILRHCEIIQNELGDDEAVATMFNKFCENLIFRSGRSRYSHVLHSMAKHCKKSRHKWMANLRHNYFNTPWAWISVLAAAFIILLTATQTWYSIISYYKK